MKPIALITRSVDSTVIDLLSCVCEVMPKTSLGNHSRQDITLIGGCTQALLVAAPELIDDAMLRYCRKLRVIACAFRIPEHIDVAACTRRGIWVTTALTDRFGTESALEAARNILDVMGGDTPRGALNEVLQPAA